MVKHGQLKISHAAGKIYRIVGTKHGTVFSLVDVYFVFKTSKKLRNHKKGDYINFWMIEENKQDLWALSIANESCTIF
jgi:hypothetical protein